MEKLNIKVNFYNTLWFRLVLGIFVCSTIAVFFISNYLSKEMSGVMTSSVSEVYKSLSDATAGRIEGMLSDVEGAGKRIRRGLDIGKTDPEEIYWRIANMMKTDRSLYYGSSVTFRPGRYHGTNMSFYCYWRGNEIVQTNLNAESYDYAKENWYTKPRDLDRELWSEPYMDEGGGSIWMSTYSVPFYEMNEDGSYLLDENGEKKFLGVVTVDVDLARIQNIINANRVYKSAYTVLFSPGGIPVHQTGGLERRSLTVSLEDIQVILTRMIYMEPQSLEVYNLKTADGTTKRVWGYQTSIGDTDWVMVSIVDEAEVLHELARTHKIALNAAILGIILLLGVVAFFAIRFTKPFQAIALETDKIAAGNLEVSADLRPYLERRSFSLSQTGEVSLLAQSVDTMRDNLKKYIASLGESLVAQERIESELMIAKNIQMSFLVQDFSLTDPRLKIHAVLQPAKAVGGDLYSFLQLDDHRLFFVVGDVSGKGVPAALFMAVTLTLMKGMVHVSGNAAVPKPSEILKQVSTDLAAQNTNTMFVTVLCGIIDTETGMLTYSNAGHLPPVLLHKDGRPAEWMKLPPGLVLGIMPNPPYSDIQVQLKDGDSIIIYTDGINEGMNIKGELFGEERLIKTVATWGNRDVGELTMGLCAAVHEHAAGAEQSDDMTIFALKYTANK